MVAALAEFHHHVEEGRDVGGAGTRTFRQEGEVALEDGAVVLLLNHSQLHLQEHIRSLAIAGIHVKVWLYWPNM